MPTLAIPISIERNGCLPVKMGSLKAQEGSKHEPKIILAIVSDGIGIKLRLKRGAWHK